MPEPPLEGLDEKLSIHFGQAIFLHLYGGGKLEVTPPDPHPP
jgi:hypothetical protein